MTASTRALAVFAAAFIGASAHAGSSLKVTLTVVLSSGPCAASVETQAVSVSCGAFASLPVLPPATAVAGAALPTLLGSSFGAYSPPYISSTPGDGTAPPLPQEIPFDPTLLQDPDQRALRQVGILPAWATGHSPMAVYSEGANLSSWRVVSNDNARHVELTISW